MLARFAAFVPALTLALVTVPPPAALAQASIRPASAIRVVDSVDRRTGRRVRDVVADPLPAEILRVQLELARAGHDPGRRNGALDGPTRRALRGFQIVEVLTICGCLSYETVVALGIRPRLVGRAAVGRRDRDRVIVVIPDGRAGRHRPRRGARRHPDISGRGHPGVSVGHAPVRSGRARPSRPRPGRSRIVLPNPPRGRPSTLRPAPRGGGAGERGARPRP